ncbi:MAG: hypothetical protein EA380_08655 [Phycisphaeraceae bacterium]|nr:MAG: hypothetical protein EA380_08655 [Phycisphaeraceae bacterium]
MDSSFPAQRREHPCAPSVRAYARAEGFKGHRVVANRVCRRFSLGSSGCIPVQHHLRNPACAVKGAGRFPGGFPRRNCICTVARVSPGSLRDRCVRWLCSGAILALGKKALSLTKEAKMTGKALTMLGAAVVTVSAVSATSGAITTDPTGLVDGPTATLVEARSRLDKGASQTWKTALITSGNTLQDTGGNTTPPNNPWVSGAGAEFTFTYDNTNGLATLLVNWGPVVEMAQATILPGAGNSLVGFRFEARSNLDAVSSLEDLGIKINGSSETLPISSIAANGSPVFVQSDNFYFTDAFSLTFFEVTGVARFTWADGVTIQGDNLRVATRLLQGVAIPTPGSVALAGLAGVAMLRRRR